MLKRQLVHQSQRRATKNRGVATRLQSAAPAQFVRLLVACSVCTHTSGDDGMRKASTWDAGEGDSDAIPFSRPHPRSKPQTVVENLHRNWNIERGHVSCILAHGRADNLALPHRGEAAERRVRHRL